MMSYYIMVTNYLTSECYRLTGSTTKNVVEAIQQAKKLNETDSHLVAEVFSKQAKFMPKLTWSPF